MSHVRRHYAFDCINIENLSGPPSRNMYLHQESFSSYAEVRFSGEILTWECAWEILTWEILTWEILTWEILTAECAETATVTEDVTMRLIVSTLKTCLAHLAEICIYIRKAFHRTQRYDSLEKYWHENAHEKYWHEKYWHEKYWHEKYWQPNAQRLQLSLRMTELKWRGLNVMILSDYKINRRRDKIFIVLINWYTHL